MNPRTDGRLLPIEWAPGERPGDTISEQTMEIAWMIGGLALWLVLQVWVLPRLGVST